MTRDLIKALLNKAVTTGSWELCQDGNGISKITIKLEIADEELEQLGGRGVTKLFNNNGARKFKFHE